MDDTNISVSVGSLLPFTTYFVQYEAMNGAGSVAAEQVDVTTLEAGRGISDLETIHIIMVCFRSNWFS